MLARFVNFCRKKFYSFFPWLLRKKQAKGHGVHSPFAFDMITNVIHSSYDFYAFAEIVEVLEQNNLAFFLNARLHSLSYRLVHYLGVKNVLEIDSGMGINTLFIMAPSTSVHCKCVESNHEKTNIAEHLLKQTGRKMETVSSLQNCKGYNYDALFINLKEQSIPDIHTLMELSSHDAFWLLHPIKKGKTKQFWDEIVQDGRIRMTFDLKDTGLVFLRQDFQKANYLV